MSLIGMKNANRPDNPDIFVKSSDNRHFSLHSPILQLRWPLFKRDPRQAAQKLSNLPGSSVTAIVEYIYGGLPASEAMRQSFKDAEVPFPTSSSADQYKSDMTRLFTSHLGSDFIVESHGQQFKVHKFVLAVRSGYFASLFSSGLSEMKNGIYIDTIAQTAGHMKIFLEYLYTGDAKLATIDDAFGLLNLAKSLFLYDNYEGEVEEFVMAYILSSHISHIDEVQSRARAKNYDKILDLIEACERI